jgi:CRISPR-associated protein Cas1
LKRHLNTLFVTTQSAKLASEGEAIVVRIDGEIAARFPLLALSGVVCFGSVYVTPPLMASCAEHGVALSFLTERGRFLARVVGKTHGNVLLRREQYRRADDEKSTREIARAFIAAKIANARSVLRRALRDRPDGDKVPAIEESLRQIAALLGLLLRAATLDECRGFEGAAAREYFAVFDHLITQQKEDFFFRDRSRRPPLDNVNAALSFVYTLLMHDMVSALESVGLDPAVGYLHRDRPGRPGLALDLVEELRPSLADRLVLSLINLRQLTADDFDRTETGAVSMTAEGRRKILVAWQKRKDEEILHPFLEEKVTIGLIPHLQALLLARHLRGDLDGYPPFVWK